MSLLSRRRLPGAWVKSLVKLAYAKEVRVELSAFYPHMINGVAAATAKIFFYR